MAIIPFQNDPLDYTDPEFGGSGGTSSGGQGGTGGGTTTPVTNAPIERPAINLNEYLDVSSPNFSRDYVKDSLRAIPSETLVFTNNSSEIDLQIRVRTINGVVFTPSFFDLNRNASQNVVVTFDPVEVNMLPEGVNQIVCAVDLSSNTLIVDPVEPSPPPPEVDSGLGIFRVEIFKFSSDGVPSLSVFDKSPSSVRWEGGVHFAAAAERTAVKWVGRTYLETGIYKFNVTVDDGVKIYVDGRIVLDSWKLQSPTSYSPTFEIAEGVHEIKVLYFNNNGSGRLNLDWVRVSTSSGTTAPGTRDPIPDSGTGISPEDTPPEDPNTPITSPGTREPVPTTSGTGTTTPSVDAEPYVEEPGTAGFFRRIRSRFIT